ncbi:MAG TPA: hypothetical protein VGM88_06705 [Kofleriaceae bacterium]|jgi:hypothetical protein
MSDGACAGCGKTIAAAETLYSTTGKPICQACFDKQDLAATRAAGKWTLPGIAAAFGIAPFLFSASSYSVEMENNKVTHFSYHDPIAIMGGIACAVLAIVLFLRATKSSPELGGKASRYLIPLALLALGAVQIARGFGVFVDPASLH